LDDVIPRRINIAKNAHLTLDERATIEVSLREGKSFTEIGRTLGKGPSTISKEVKTIDKQFEKEAIILMLIV